MVGNKHNEEREDGFIGDLLTTTILAGGAIYLEPYIGSEADWVVPLLYVAAGLRGIKGVMRLIKFWRNQIKRFNARYRPTNSKGSARWATQKDIRKAGLYKLDTKGVFLGVETWGKPMNDLSDSHVLVEAPTGAGKTSCIIKPTVFHNDQSQIIIDINGDIAESTVLAAQKYQGKKTIIVDPIGLLGGKFGASSRYNPLLRLVKYWKSDDKTQHQKMVVKASELAGSLFPEPKQDNNNDHFRLEAIKWVKCLFLYMVTHLPAEEVTYTNVLELLRSTVEFENALQVARCSDVLDNDLASMASAILDQLENINDHGYTKSIRDVALHGFDFATRSGSLAEAMSASDFSIADLQDHRTNLYLIIPPDMMKACKPFIESFFWAITDEIIESQNEVLLLFLVDEATNFRLPDISRNLTLLRNYKCKFVIIVQDHQEYANVHGEAAKNVLLSQTGVKVFMNPQSPSSMELIAKLCGETTVMAPSHNIGESWTDEVSIHMGEQQRRLLTPGEAREADHAVIIYKNLPPIKAYLIPFFLVWPWQIWQGISGLRDKVTRGETLLSLRYHTLHHVLRYHAKRLLSTAQTIADDPLDYIKTKVRNIVMAPVRVIRRAKARLNPFRLLKSALNGLFLLTTRTIEWLLPFAPLALLIWLFIGDSTPHILLEKSSLSCTYGGFEGYKYTPNNDCSFFRMLP